MKQYSTFWNSIRSVDSVNGIITFIIMISILSRVLLALRPEAQLFSRPFGDDAYYVLSYAENIVHGHGLTVDRIHQSNGLQPLLLALYVPSVFFAGESKVLAVRYAMLSNYSIDIINLILLALLLKRICKYIGSSPSQTNFSVLTGIMAWAVLDTVVTNGINGLETSLVTLFYLLSLLQYLKIWQLRRNSEDIPLQKWIVLGITLGFGVLARIDTVFLVGGFILSEYFIRENKHYRKLVALSVASFLVSSPWWLYNYFTYNSLMPISGQSESMPIILSKNLYFSLISLFNIICPVAPFPVQYGSVWFAIGWIVSVLAFLFIVERLFKVRSFISSLNLHALFIPLLALSFGALVYYTFFFGAYWYIPRYLQPLRLYWIILSSLLLPYLIYAVKDRFRFSRRVMSLMALIVILPLGTYNIMRFMKNFDGQNVCGLYLAGKWGAEHSNERIGMFSSGTAGFIADNIVNLDGKVNPETLAQRKNRQLADWIRNGNITILAAWQWELDYYLKGIQDDDNALTMMHVFPVSFDKTYGYVQLYRIERSKRHENITSIAP